MLKTTALVALFAILGLMPHCTWHRATSADAQLTAHLCSRVSELIPEKNYEL